MSSFVNVLLPLPFSPVSATISPVCTCVSAWDRITFSSSYAKERSLAVSAALPAFWTAGFAVCVLFSVGMERISPMRFAETFTSLTSAIQPEMCRNGP